MPDPVAPEGTNDTLLGNDDPAKEADPNKEADPGKEVDPDADKKADQDPDKSAEKDKDADKDGEKEEKKEGAPEEYEAFTMPEGMDVNEEALSTFSGLGKKHNLSQADAQELVDVGVKLVDDAQAKTLAAVQEEFAKTVTDWKKETQADKDLLAFDGGFDAAVGVAVQAVEALGGQELRSLLNSSGLGNNNLVVKAFFKVGKLMQQDKFVFGSAPKDKPTSAAQKIYTTMSS